MYCRKCGNELTENEAFCPACGTPINNESSDTAKENGTTSAKTQKTGFHIASEILMCISIVTVVFSTLSVPSVQPEPYVTGTIVSLIIQLFWMIPMTIKVFKVKKTSELSVAFKICTLLFVNLLAGIFLLCDKEQQN